MQAPDAPIRKEVQDVLLRWEFKQTILDEFPDGLALRSKVIFYSKSRMVGVVCEIPVRCKMGDTLFWRELQRAPLPSDTLMRTRSESSHAMVRR